MTFRFRTGDRIALRVSAAAALVALSGKNPLEAIAAMAAGAAGSPHQIGVALNRATPYLLAGSGVAIGFRAGINIGAEGQIALAWPPSAGPLTAVAALAGAAWAAIATAIPLGLWMSGR